MQTPLLEVTNLRKEFGGLMAVFDVNFGVELGEILAIIGPNGAGKTTPFNLISGVLPPTRGTIRFRGHLLNELKIDSLDGTAKCALGPSLGLNGIDAGYGDVDQNDRRILRCISGYRSCCRSR